MLCFDWQPLALRQWTALAEEGTRYSLDAEYSQPKKCVLKLGDFAGLRSGVGEREIHQLGNPNF